METQTWLSCHCKFISSENITILSVSSDDFLHAFLKVADIYITVLPTCVLVCLFRLYCCVAKTIASSCLKQCLSHSIAIGRM